MKNRQPDYLVGLHGPAFDESFGNIGRTFLTIHLSMLSLGTFPFWGSVGSESKFMLYDKNLKLLDSKSYASRYEFIAGWWGNAEEGEFMLNRGVPSHMKINIYKPQIIEYSDNLVEFLHTR